jgi:hypothetical protein
MGYRSDVAYTIRFVDDHDTNNSQSFYTFLAEAKTKPECAIALAEVKVDAKQQRFTFTAENVKWYETYPDVMSHTALVDLACSWAKQAHEGELHCKIGVAFVRVGEDLSDIQEIFDGHHSYEWVQVERKINTDWS